MNQISVYSSFMYMNIETTFEFRGSIIMEEYTFTIRLTINHSRRGCNILRKTYYTFWFICFWNHYNFWVFALVLCLNLSTELNNKTIYFGKNLIFFLLLNCLNIFLFFFFISETEQIFNGKLIYFGSISRIAKRKCCKTDFKKFIEGIKFI